MLTKWIFIMILDGKAEIVSEKPTEALCRQAMIRIMAVEREKGVKPVGGCYILTTE